jgi:S-DNA-T family DNA segregation ATPase FtsK/SpoIIIE
MGRAAGMHLVIATQRPLGRHHHGPYECEHPEPDCVRVSSAMESRIILDSQAPRSSSHGRYAVCPAGSGKPIRVQGAFVSDQEREDIISFKKSAATRSTAMRYCADREAAEEKGQKGDSGKPIQDERAATTTSCCRRG